MAAIRRLAWLLLAAAPLAAVPAAAQDDECTYTVGRSGTATISQACEDELAALATDEERAAMLFRLGWSMNERQAAQGALAVLKRAVAFAPDNPDYLTELGYTQGDLGLLRDALVSLDRALAIDPGHTLALNERGWARQMLGDFEGANADYDRLLAIEDTSAGVRLSYAQNLVWLGRLDEAEARLDRLAGDGDLAGEIAEQRALIRRIRAYRPEGDPAALCDLTESIVDRPTANALFDACTRAFLDTADAEKRADFLTVRATARKIIDDSLEAGFDDLRIAAGIDPAHGRRYLNTGFALLQSRHSWAARNDFDKALELGLPQDLMTAVAMAGRAQANYNLGEYDAAFADAKASFEVEPNVPALMLLGDLSFDRDDNDSARLFYMGAYHLGSRDDSLIDRLGEVGIDDPENWQENEAG